MLTRRVVLSQGGGWDTVRVWEETLSLGEQQRLAMARCAHVATHAVLFLYLSAAAAAAAVYCELHNN